MPLPNGAASGPVFSAVVSTRSPSGESEYSIASESEKG